jgi:hypothetical protein
MGRALTVDECLKQAQECLTLARSTPEPELREQYLKLAANLQELAAMLANTQAPSNGDAIPGDPGKKRAPPWLPPET